MGNELLRKYAKKHGILNWFRSNGCSADISMRKTVLRDFTEKLKPREKIYKTGQISSAHEHKVARFAPTLLPHMCDLNPIELPWVKPRNPSYISIYSKIHVHKEAAKINV